MGPLIFVLFFGGHFVDDGVFLVHPFEKYAQAKSAFFFERAASSGPLFSRKNCIFQ